jgi:hypothetical protein
MKDLNITPETVKLLGEKHRKTFGKLECERYFGQDSKNTGDKVKKTNGIILK